ncbi:MAG: response regulator transcription factor [Candidatus Limnocylindrales bacterium]
MSTDRPPILVVDDDAKIRRLVRTYLERDGPRVVEAADGPTAVAALRRARPALVVLDLMLPGIDGLSIIRDLRASGRPAAERPPILVLSARGLTSDRIEGLSVGADDYLAKPFSPAELALRVRRLLERAGASGSGNTGRALLRLGDLAVDQERHEVRVGDRIVELSPTGFRLLVALLEADGRVLTRDGLLDALYGQDDDAVLDRTIDANIRRLRAQLGDDAEDPRYIATVRGVGYRAVTRGEPTP